jgi:hypothetical protein
MVICNYSDKRVCYWILVYFYIILEIHMKLVGTMESNAIKIDN